MRVIDLAKWLVLGRENGVRSRFRGWVGSRSIFGRTERTGAASSDPSDPGPSGDTVRPVGGPEGFLLAGRSDEVADEERMEVTLGGQPLLLVRHAGVLRCVSAVCPHAGGALGDGFVESGHVMCPLHGWTFALDSGQCSVNPSVRLPCFEVAEGEGWIWVRLAGENPSESPGDELP